MILVANEWKEYELIMAGAGQRLERWGNFTLRRPDPQVIWPLEEESRKWQNPDAVYHRNSTGGGKWEYKKQLPERWTIKYKDLSFYVKPTGFKHTGLFPEQAVNWDWIIKKIEGARRPIRVLNLFAYTGGATVASLYAGAEVTHVDSAKGMVQLAKENVQLSNLSERPVRFIVDDVFKFVQKEERRGKKYDAIIMDPPSFGRGLNGEVWKIEEHLYAFLQSLLPIISDEPLFFLINSYTTGLSPTVLNNLLVLTIGMRYGGKITTGEVGLPISASRIVLPAGIFARWEDFV